MSSKAPVFRFAPSPNGRLHLGHAYSALVNDRLAKEIGGRFLLRIEDIDPTRCTIELAQYVLDDLDWLGLDWEEPIRMQSQHFDDYEAAFNRLKEMDVIYPCFCSRKEISEASSGTDPDGAPLYPGTCRSLSAGKVVQNVLNGMPNCWRLNMQKALRLVPKQLKYTVFHPGGERKETRLCDPTRWGDAILVRKETPTSYHLSVVVDDALQGVTHVVRGKDLEAATDIHVLLQHLLGLPTPYYYHHTLIEAPEGGKLAKSEKSPSIAELRDAGKSAEDIRAMVPGVE